MFRAGAARTPYRAFSEDLTEFVTRCLPAGFQSTLSPDRPVNCCKLGFTSEDC